MNTLEEGQWVLVTDYMGVKSRKKVWQDLGETVLITSERNMKALDLGRSDIWPIAVPRETIETDV